MIRSSENEKSFLNAKIKKEINKNAELKKKISIYDKIINPNKSVDGIRINYFKIKKKLRIKIKINHKNFLLPLLLE